MEYYANISMPYPDFPMTGRIVQASRAGFDWVEIQFPSEGGIDEMLTACLRERIGIAQVNTPRGIGDEVGLAALPGRQADFRGSVSVGLSQAGRLGAGKVNILARRPDSDAGPQTCLDVYLDNIRYAADAFAGIDVRVMIEPVNQIDRPGLFLSGLEFALNVLNRADHPNVAILFDFYHLAISEPDLAQAVNRAGPHIGHVQFADTPGRYERWTGTTDFETALKALGRTGYHGMISAEYSPQNGTAAGLAWLPRFREITD